MESAGKGGRKISPEGDGKGEKKRKGGAKKDWTLYAALLFVRVVVSPLLPGYIHPDEFFQGGQELWFGCPPTVPWEFEPENALRSVVPPALMTWIPIQVYSWLSGRSLGSLSGGEVLVVPRVACALLSILTMDCSLWRICNFCSKTDSVSGVPTPVLLLASAWPCFAMLARPFSNALESYVVAALLSAVVCNSQTVYTAPSSAKPAVFAFQVGSLAALGIFTRFTFAFFAFPVLLFLLNDMIRTMGLGRRLLFNILLMAVSFSLIAAGIVAADSLFYSSRRPFDDGGQTLTHTAQAWSTSSRFWSHSLVLTPYNALAYNSQVSNLADHGLHPRWTHAAVNMFILYGPLALVGYLYILTKSSAVSVRLPPRPRSGVNDSNGDDEAKAIAISQAVVLLGLGFLSAAPHQEPRFLLPLICPLAVMGSKLVQSKVGKFLWVLFNLIMFAIFGVLHQAGVTESLLAIGTSDVLIERIPVAWIYLRTYMPPTFLTRHLHGVQGPKGIANVSAEFGFGNIGAACGNERRRVVDLNGARMRMLSDTLGAELDCAYTASHRPSRHVQLVVPSLTETDDDGSTYSFTRSGVCELPGDEYACRLVWSSRPHLTTEDFPSWKLPVSEFLYEFGLSIYEVSCANSES